MFVNTKLDKKKIYILAGVGGFVVTTLLVILLIRRKRKRKNMSVIVKGEYTVPANAPYRVDALHSFERRKLDGFGGRMSTKIMEALKKMYNDGINPEVTDLKINVDSKNYKVTWQAKIEPSKDGKAYTGFVTRGSAGGGADSRALSQIDEMKRKTGGKDYKLVLDFKNPTGIYIRQLFYQYQKDEFPAK
jgi:hypothetical protein